MFNDVVNLVDSIVPVFTSILDLIIAIFPIIIAMIFFVGLAILIQRIFDGAVNFKSLKK